MRQLKIGLGRHISFSSNEPLHSRVPSRDEFGNPLSDFMMLLPGFRNLPRREQSDRLDRIQIVLTNFTEVVYADLNVPLNLLWISVEAKYGITGEIAAELQYHIPEARLVGSYLPR